MNICLYNSFIKEGTSKILRLFQMKIGLILFWPKFIHSDANRTIASHGRQETSARQPAGPAASSHPPLQSQNCSPGDGDRESRPQRFGEPGTLGSGHAALRRGRAQGPLHVSEFHCLFERHRGLHSATRICEPDRTVSFRRREEMARTARDPS